MQKFNFLKFAIIIVVYTLLNNIATVGNEFSGEKTKVGYIQPKNNNPFYSYATTVYDIGKDYNGDTQETETTRTKFTFNLTSIPDNATINEVQINYTISNNENSSYYFKITQIGDYSSPQEIYQNIGSAPVLFADVLYNFGTLNNGTLTSMVNNSKGSYLNLGAFSQNESNLDSKADLDLTLSLTYSVPPTTVDITARNNFLYGTVK